MTHDFNPGGLHVLVVDDNSINRKFAARTLASAGHHSVQAENGRQAISTLLASHDVFDLILMDGRMPGMDGFEATRLIRQLQNEGQLPVKPVVAVTAFDAEDCGQQRKISDAHLAKPYAMEDLVELIGSIYPNADPNRNETPVHSAMPEPLPRPMNTESILDLCGGEMEIAKSLLKTFIDDGAGCIERMKTGWTEGDPKQINAAAHSLKGASGMLTAQRVFELAKQIELITVPEADSSDVESLLAQIESEFHRCVTFDLTQ